MPLISFAPGPAPGVTMINADKTIGPTTSIGRTGSQPASPGVIPASGAGTYPQYNLTGKYADAGEVADCLNMLVARIQALEAVLASDPGSGITQT